MGARLLLDLLYKSELVDRDSLLVALLLAELPTDEPNPLRAEPIAAPKELPLPKPRDALPGWPGP